jgi:hypothetical protein
MMALSPIQSVEAFHLVFLRVLEAKADRSLYVVKGGVNLRAWFGSQRYSEDLDIDVMGGESFALRDRVDGVLRAPALGKLLKTLGLMVRRSSKPKPKQTETTQRWKFELEVAGMGSPVHTKIEFSRRGSDDKYVLEPVLPEIVRPYGVPAPAANHYTAASAIGQKIGALAGRREAQARDVWDLDHLFRMKRVDPRPLSDAMAAALPIALERVVDMPFETFRAQVVPFLAPDAQDLFGTRDAWQRIQGHVLDRLAEIHG